MAANPMAKQESEKQESKATKAEQSPALHFHNFTSFVHQDERPHLVVINDMETKGHTYSQEATLVHRQWMQSEGQPNPEHFYIFF